MPHALAHLATPYPCNRNPMAWAMRQPQRKGARQANGIGQLAAYRARRVSSLRQLLLLLPFIFALVFRKRALLFYNPHLHLHLHTAYCTIRSNTVECVAVSEATVFKAGKSRSCAAFCTTQYSAFKSRMPMLRTSGATGRDTPRQRVLRLSLQG